MASRASGFDSTIALFTGSAETLVEEARVDAARSRAGDDRQAGSLREIERTTGLERADAADRASKWKLFGTVFAALAEVVRGIASILSAVSTREAVSGDASTAMHGRRVEHASTVLEEVAALLDVGTGIVGGIDGAEARPQPSPSTATQASPSAGLAASAEPESPSSIPDAPPS